MAVRIHRVLIWIIPVQCATMLAFAWYASRPAPPTVGSRADRIANRIVVSKSAHTLTLYANNAPLRSYSVALGRAAGRKQQQGDHRTPEGRYTVDARNPQSAFHLALHLSYPNADDLARQATGGDIMIHGVRNGLGLLGPIQHMADWTDGCIAVSNAEMDEIYRLVPNNTPVDIEP